MKRGRKPKAALYETRDPVYETRDPKSISRETTAPEQRKKRHYISAPMPLVCPTCGHNTRMADGKHTDPVRRKLLEYRTCCWCGELLAAGRDMTPREVEKYCTRAAAVAEYEAEAINPNLGL